MAALLMPRRLFRRLALREIRQLGLDTPPVATENMEDLTTALAKLLQVSKQAARIRLDSEGLVARD
jgi:hypothetical protein